MRKLQNNNDETELRDERYSEMITEHGRDLTPPVRYHSWEGNYKESGDNIIIGIIEYNVSILVK